MIVSGQLNPLETSPSKVTTGFAVQLSVGLTTVEMEAGGISPLHSTVSAGRGAAVGGVISCTVMVCVTVLVFPLASAKL